MSFLDELNYRKSLLKNTETIVTHTDGRRFVHCKDGIVPIEDVKYGFVIDTKPDNKPSLIIDNIYLGSQDCVDLIVLREHNINFVLSLGIEPIFDYPYDIAHAFIECLDLPEANLIKIIHDCIPFIKRTINDDKNILIHCNAGISRSSAVVIGFLILERKFTYLDAYDIVKKGRNCIKPNVGFVKQLKSLSSNDDNK